MQRTGSDDHGIRGGAQQAHDETVAFVETADVAASGLARYLVAHHSIERADEISNHVGAAATRFGKP